MKNFCQKNLQWESNKCHFHFSHYMSMETCNSNQSIYATARQTNYFVEHFCKVSALSPCQTVTTFLATCGKLHLRVHVYRRGCQIFRSNPSTGATQHVYNIIGKTALDYYDLVRVSSTLVKVLQHAYEIPSILFKITMCLYRFIRVLHNQSQVCTL